MENALNPGKKILVQRADKLGDVVFILPVLRWLNDAFPDIEIHCLSSAVPAEFLREQSMVSRVIEVSNRPGFVEINRLASTLKAEKYDTYLSLWNEPAFAWLGLLTGIPIRIGDSTNKSLSWLYTHTIRQPWENLRIHQIEFNMMLLRPFGWDGRWAWRIDVSTAAKARVADAVSDYGDDSPIIVFICGTGGSNVPISDDAIIESAEVLSETARVILVGSGISGKIADYHRDAILNMTNKTSLSELVAWIDLADVVIGADTGPIHIAAALNKSIVFCPIRKANLPTRFGPWGRRVEVIRRDYICPVLAPQICDDPACKAMPNDIDLIDAVDRILENPVSMKRTELRRLFFVKSIHILIVVKSTIHYHAMRRLSKRWRVHGMIAIPVINPNPSALYLARMARRYNTAVVFAPGASRFAVIGARLLAGTIFKYIVPTYVTMNLSVNEDLEIVIGWINEWFDAKVGYVR